MLKIVRREDYEGTKLSVDHQMNERRDDWVPITLREFFSDPLAWVGLGTILIGLGLWALILLRLLGDI